MTYYIYKIENKVNHKKYIGLTNNIARRRARHFSDLACNRHDNSFLQKEYNIYGKENFDFNIEFKGDVTDYEIGEKEKEYIKKYDSYRNGYNQNEGGNFGPSNGGTHLTQIDIFNILAALEFMSRPGQVLSNMYDVSKTTISRIKQGVNHNQYKEEYDALPLEKRQEIYQSFCDSTDFCKDKAVSSSLQSKRKFTEEQIHMILVNEERGRIYPLTDLMEIFNIDSSNTFYCIFKGKSYRDYAMTYKDLSQDQKNELSNTLKKLRDEKLAELRENLEQTTRSQAS